MKKGLFELQRIDDIKERIYEMLILQAILNIVVLSFDIIAIILGYNYSRKWLYLYSSINLIILTVGIICYHINRRKIQ